MRKLFSMPLGVSNTPFGDLKRDPWSAAIQASADMTNTGINNIFGWINNNKTNNANRDIAHETNEYNYKIWQEQRAAAKEQYEKEFAENRYLLNQSRQWQNEDFDKQVRYNDPAYIMQRYRAAGLNPGLMMEHQSMGSVGNTSSTGVGSPAHSVVPDAPQMVTGAPVMPYDFTGLGVGMQHAMDLFLTAQKQESDISTSNARLLNETLQLMNTINDSDVDRQYKKQLIEGLIEDLKFNKDSHGARLTTINETNDKLKAEALYTRQLAEGQEFANSVAPQLHELNKKTLSANIAVAAAQYDELMSRKDLNESQRELVGKKIAEQALINGNLPKSLHNDNSIKVATYNQIKKQADMIHQQTETERWHTLDARKGYRQHIGSDRSIEDIIEHALGNSKGKRMPSMQ